MKTINVTKARANLYRLLNEANESHEPIQITGKNGTVVLIAEEDWRAIQETLHLTSISGMKDSIIEGLNTSVEDCVEKLDW